MLTLNRYRSGEPSEWLSSGRHVVDQGRDFGRVPLVLHAVGGCAGCSPEALAAAERAEEAATAAWCRKHGVSNAR